MDYSMTERYNCTNAKHNRNTTDESLELINLECQINIKWKQY